MQRFFLTVATITQRELIRYWRDKARIFVTLFQPLMFLFVFGSGLRQSLSGGNLGVDFLQFMYPGIIAMSVMGVAFFSTVSTVWDREFGFLKEILVAPVPRTAIAMGKTAGATLIASLQALILLGLGPFIGVTIHAHDIPSRFLFMVLLAFAVSGVGLLMASIVRTIENFGVIMNLMVFPMFFLSGAFFPLTAVPSWMSALSKINPLSYGVDAFRRILLEGQMPAAALERISLHTVQFNAVFLLAFSSVMIFSAVVAFNKRG